LKAFTDLTIDGSLEDVGRSSLGAYGNHYGCSSSLQLVPQETQQATLELENVFLFCVLHAWNA
jgi:hypothetical protein